MLYCYGRMRNAECGMRNAYSRRARLGGVRVEPFSHRHPGNFSQLFFKKKKKIKKKKLQIRIQRLATRRALYHSALGTPGECGMRNAECGMPECRNAFYELIIPNSMSTSILRVVMSVVIANIKHRPGFTMKPRSEIINGVVVVFLM